MTNSTLRNRLARGIGANAFAQLTTTTIQILSIPAFLSVWSVAQYGEWLLISSIAAYFSLLDGGITAAAAAEMTRLIARGEREKARELVSQATFLVFLISVSILSLLAIIILTNGPRDFFSEDRNMAGAFLCLSMLSLIISGLFDAVFRSTERYAEGVALNNFARLAEWSGWVIGAWLFKTFSGAALVGLVIRVSSTMLIAYKCQSRAHGLSITIRGVSLRQALPLVRDSVHFLAFPVANTCTFHGVNLLIGAGLGPVAVAIFNTHRTLMRLVYQAATVVTNPSGPEFARAAGTVDVVAISKLYRHSNIACFITSIGIAVVIALIAAPLMKFWTKGAIGYQPILGLVMLAYVLIAAFWHVPRLLLQNIGHFYRISKHQVVVTFIMLGLVWLVGHSIAAAAAFMALMELWMLGLAFQEVRRYFQASRRQSTGAI